VYIQGRWSLLKTQEANGDERRCSSAIKKEAAGDHFASFGSEAYSENDGPAIPSNKKN
jgi:hypothetical protein